VHLLLVISLLASKLDNVRRKKMTIMFDFSRETAKELEEKLLQEKEKLADEVDALFRQARDGKVIRNIAVNSEDLKTSTLKDDKGINEKVYEDARQLQEKLNANREKQNQLANNEVPVYENSAKNQPKKESYKGPTVLTYTLEGRRAMKLPVPVYKCPYGGDVCVQIEVNQNGSVSKASVILSASASNECLHEAAIAAAKLSRFNADDNAPKSQTGTILYRFVAQ
jgi:TonB family protein